MIPQQDIIDALQLVSDTYGNELARRLEQLFRNETAHFKSGNFQKTLSPGMEAFADTFPYGWKTPKTFWTVHPEYAPKGIFKQVENSSAMMKSRGERRFIQFANCKASFMTVAYIINFRGGDAGLWFSNTNTPEGIAARAKYNGVLNTIIPHTCVDHDIA